MIPYEDIADLANRCADPQMPPSIRETAARVLVWVHAPTPWVVPALLQLRPDKPPRPIIAGETWTKRASGKNSNNRPRIVVSSVRQKAKSRMVDYSHLPDRWPCRTQTERTFRRDWE